MFKFSKNEIKVFKSICLGNRMIEEIRMATSISNREIYRIIDSLKSKRIIRIEKSRPKRLELDSNLHSISMKNYVLADVHPIDAIIGSKLLILLSISTFPKNVDRIAVETMMKKESVRKLIWDLKRYGMINQKGKVIAISPSNDFMIKFAQDFSKGANNAVLDTKAKTGIILWNEGLRFIFAAVKLDHFSGVKTTGISAMSDHGLDFISNTNYFYYAFWHPKLRTEDIAIHNLLINPKSSKNIGFTLLLLRKEGFDLKYLLDEARCTGIEKFMREILRYLSGKNVDNKQFPSEREMEELLSLYEVI